MKLIIAGGRDYIFNLEDIKKLNSIEGITEVVSGGAKGADSMWENGVVEPWNKEIFSPYDESFYNIPVEDYDISMKHHPAWRVLPEGVKSLMARNVQILLGEQLDKPVQFVLAVTLDGADGVEKPTTRETGGTGHTIRCAIGLDIPVYNLMGKPIHETMEWIAHRMK